ncbi:MAG: peptidylprolyl isomerase [Enterocloster asparagiformis]|nr:peptidylprolyl isomerase [Enterocloster asparagiformis]
MRKMTYTLLAAAMAAAVLAGCSRNGEAQKTTQTETSAAQETVKADGQEKETEAETEAVELATGRHHVKIEVKDYGTISVELYGDEAPISVTNFLKLAGDGFYDGLTFHRIISGFMIQGGDPQGTGMGGSDEMIKGEFSANGVNNPLKHTRGAISMARSQYPDSASSQFFIVHQDSTRLDGQYAAFGYVTEGMDVVDKLCEDTPVQDGNGTVAKEDQPVIERIEVVD